MKEDNVMTKESSEIQAKVGPSLSEGNLINSGGKLNRREMVRQMTLAGLGLAFLRGTTLAQKRDEKKTFPYVRFKRNEKGDGVIGPYGEVRVYTIDEEVLPVFASTISGGALMNMTGRTPLVRIGKGSTAITFTAGGVTFGTIKEQKWSKGVVRKVIDAIAKDREKAGELMLLGSAIQISYPAAAAQTKSPKGKRIGAALANSAKNYGASAMNCKTERIKETAEREVTEWVKDIKTAAEQYQECYDREVKRDPCKSFLLGAGAGPCAAAICAGKAFIDVVVGLIKVTTTIVDEVFREVTTCAPKLDEWPNPFTGIVNVHPQNGLVKEAKKINFSREDIGRALDFLKNIGGSFGPVGKIFLEAKWSIAPSKMQFEKTIPDFPGPFKCLLDGEWSLAQLDTQLNFGGNIVIPYGIKVCISDECATQLGNDDTFSQELGAMGSALSVLAALSPEFAASAAAVGIVASPAVAAHLAALSPAVIAAATVIVALIIIVLFWGTAISAQLAFHRNFTNNFADGKVCIEHPTFALALVEMMTLGFAPTEIIPPIVTG